ncbi:hypothetical protein AnigIFM56816_000195 [Aspergillus niger]|nr:hypothetical protein AnigIFM56816_000195 [Aspergillus niger]
MRGEKEESTSTNAEAELDALFAAYEGTLAEHRAILDSELLGVLEKCLPRLKNVTTVGLRSYPLEFLLSKANYRSFRCLGLRELKKFNTDDFPQGYVVHAFWFGNLTGASCHNQIQSEGPIAPYVRQLRLRDELGVLEIARVKV